MAPNTLNQKRKTAREAAGKVEQHFPFLKLSPELRNRIYDYACEELHDRIAPHVTQFSPPVHPYESRLWKFFALTQTCKIIRAEYRPLWMRQLSVRLTMLKLRRFTETFLSNASQLKHSPNLVQIVWKHGVDGLGWEEITPLLPLRAHCPQFRCQFIPSNISARLDRYSTYCVYCIEELRLEGHGMSPAENPWEGCTCASSDMDDEDWEKYQYDQIEYTNAIRNFAHNANDAWRKDVRENKVRVRCRFARPSFAPTFRILYAEQVCNDANIKPGWELLNSWGLFDLPGLENAAFMLAYESTRKSKEGGYDVVHSLLREVHFTKAKSEE